MDVGAFTSLISSVGFPIACVIAMGFYFVWERKQRIEENRSRDNVIKDLTTTVNNNTIALEKLIERLGAK
jgi:hypothetical protein